MPRADAHPFRRAQATRALLDRYALLIDAAAIEGEDLLAQDARLSLANLAWMCAEAASHCEAWPIDKASRWLGFVQGCLAMRGLIDVDAERGASTPIFHRAYRAEGIEAPASVERG